MAGTLCGRIGLAAALELELELGEAGESAPLRFRPRLIPLAGSPFWWLWPLLQLWLLRPAEDPACLEPRMLSMVNRDAAAAEAAPPLRSSSRIVAPD